jgi:hypothetical protein
LDDILVKIKNRRTNVLVRGLLGSQSHDDMILPRFLDILKTLPIHRDIQSNGHVYWFKPFDLIDSAIDDRFDSSIQQLHHDIQKTIMVMLNELSDGRIELDEKLAYRITFLFDYYRSFLREQGVTKTYVMKDLITYDSKIEKKYHVYNSLISSSNFAHQLYNSKLAKERLSRDLGDDYNPDNNFHGMEYISSSNVNKIEMIRDVAVFFGALFRSGHHFKFDGTKIRRRSDALDLFADDNDVYYFYPCPRCKNGYRINLITLDSEFDNISDPAIYKPTVSISTLSADITQIIKGGAPYAFLPDKLKYIPK